MDGYELIDSGNGKKLERFGRYRLIRPCSQAVWRPDHSQAWSGAIGFVRDANGWELGLPETWTVEIHGIKLRLAPTPFGHIGVFPEHSAVWRWVTESRPTSLLNLFAYSGGLTVSAAKVGIEVCHLDASRGMVAWARQNAELNALADAPIRWIVDDVHRFLAREVKRGRRYDAIVMDPPTFGRGKRGEVFKIEHDLPPLLAACRQLRPRLLIVSCHTPGFSPLVLEHLVQQAGFDGVLQRGELVLEGKRSIPCGAYVQWKS